MHDTLFKIGPFSLKYYSFFIFLGMLVACFLIFKEAKRKKINEDLLTNILFYGIIIGILGARSYYVLFNLDYYLKNPLEIFMIWHGGLAIHGGLIAGLIFLIINSKKHNLNIFKLLDIIVVGVIIAQSIGRWGNFFNQEAYGPVTPLSNLKSMHLPNFIIKGMYIDGSYHEPTFFYESVISLLGFIVLILIRKLKNLKVGTLTGIYLIWYGIERFIIESLRTDSLMLGNIKVAQLVSLIFIIFGIIVTIFSFKKNILYHRDNL